MSTENLKSHCIFWFRFLYLADTYLAKGAQRQKSHGKIKGLNLFKIILLVVSQESKIYIPTT